MDTTALKVEDINGEAPVIILQPPSTNDLANLTPVTTVSEFQSTKNNGSTGPTVSFSLPLVQHHSYHHHTSVISPHSPSSGSNLQDELISEEEARRRRELLARRPSYRKILNDLSGAELDLRHRDSGDSGGDSEDSNTSDSTTMTGSQGGIQSATIGGSVNDAISYAASIIPHGALHLSTNSNGDLSVGGLLPPGAASGLFQYPIQDGGQQQILVPMSGSDLLGLKPVIGGSTSPSVAALVSQGLIGFPSSAGNLTPSSISSVKSSMSNQMGHSSASGNGNHGMGDDTNKKRELRLLKNREAAKECRRKKKEYVKCLENRVTVLEAQNKQLIEELRALKELYCRKGD